MILVKTPLRITFGGGGTDIFDYSDQYNGYCLGATINKYCYITLNKNYYDKYTILKYSKTEKILNKKKIIHRIFNKVLNSIEYNHGLEISTFMDVPSSTGLGSSSSFSVGLFNAISFMNKSPANKKYLAVKAVELERFILKEKGGVQDQFLCSYGGINEININKDRHIKIKKIDVSKKNLKNIEKGLSLFYLGKERLSNEIQKKTFPKKISRKKIEALHKIKANAYDSKRAIISGDIEGLGKSLHQNWILKKSLSTTISSNYFDKVYEIAIKNGAIGGKLLGAGGGGFYLFCSHNLTEKNKLILKLKELNIKELTFQFEYTGSKLYNF